MLAWNDLRYGSKYAHPELTQQALQNAFDIWCKRGGYIYANLYPFQRYIEQTDAPLYQRIQQMNDRLTASPDSGEAIPGTLTCDQPHYQNDPNQQWGYSGPSTGHNPKDHNVPTWGWKSWIVTCKQAGEYTIALTAAGGSTELRVDDAVLAAGDAGAGLKATVKLTPGVHSIKVKSLDKVVKVDQILVTQQ